jgi:hypothetical protein
MLGELYIKYDPNADTNVFIITDDATNGVQLNCNANIFNQENLGGCTDITTQIETILSRLHNLNQQSIQIANVIIATINYTVTFDISDTASTTIDNNTITITRTDTNYSIDSLSSMLGELYIKYDPNETTNVLIIGTDHNNAAQLDCIKDTLGSKNPGYCNEINSEIETILYFLHNLNRYNYTIEIAKIDINSIDYTITFALDSDPSSAISGRYINIIRTTNKYTAKTLSDEVNQLCINIDTEENLTIYATTTGCYNHAKPLKSTESTFDTINLKKCKAIENEKEELAIILDAIESDTNTYNNAVNIEVLRNYVNNDDLKHCSLKTIEAFAKSVAYNTDIVNYTISKQLLDKYQRIEQSTDALSSDEVEDALNCIMYYECGE